MKKFFQILLIVTMFCFTGSSFALSETADNVFKAGVSISEQVPKALFGTWRVASEMIDTDSPGNFKKNNVDIWNLSKDSNVIKLSNPFSGATASITVSYACNNAIRFTKKSKYDGKMLTDTVELYLDKETFSGINTIVLETLSDVDNSVIKTAKATYTLKGEKIAGEYIK